MTLDDLRYEVCSWIYDQLQHLKWNLVGRWRNPVQGNHDLSIELDYLIHALDNAFCWGEYKHCPLHPGNISTPTGPRCCTPAVLAVEDLSPIMHNVTYNEKSIKLRKTK